MGEREKMMLERIRPERHESAMMTLATIKFIKEECKKTRICSSCKFSDNISDCCFCDEYKTPEYWDEYDMTERIYK